MAYVCEGVTSCYTYVYVEVGVCVKQHRAVEIQNAQYTRKEDWKGNDLVACVHMLRSFVTVRAVFQHLVELGPAASLVPTSSTELDRRHIPV